MRLRLIAEHTERIGVNSIAIVTLSSAAIGMIFSLQLTLLLLDFQAESMVGAAVGLTLAREMAPVVTALMLIAKNGSAMAAELGTMRVSEQIDAMQTMNVDPVHYLVFPRVITSTSVFLILTALANVVGLIGAYIVAVFSLNVDPGLFLDRLYWFLEPADVISGLIKAAVFGFMVSTICCFYGFVTSGGSKGVGEASTKAVVTSSIGILVADYIMASIMLQVLY